MTIQQVKPIKLSRNMGWSITFTWLQLSKDVFACLAVYVFMKEHSFAMHVDVVCILNETPRTKKRLSNCILAHHAWLMVKRTHPSGAPQLCLYSRTSPSWLMMDIFCPCGQNSSGSSDTDIISLITGDKKRWFTHCKDTSWTVLWEKINSIYASAVGIGACHGTGWAVIYKAGIVSGNIHRFLLS